MFSNEIFGNVRMTKVNGKPYAVAIDLAKVLEYPKPTEAVRINCKGDPIYTGVIDSLGRSQQTRVISQGDILRLIVKAADQSRNLDVQKKAQDVERWIFDEVIPAVLNTGSYTVNDVIPMLNTITKRLEESENRNDKLQQSVDKLSDNIAIRRYEDPKNRLMAYDTRHGAVMGSRHTRTFYDDIANYLGVDIPKSSMIPKGMFLWEFIVAKYNLDDIESFIVGIEHGTIVKSKAKNWVNLNGYRADRQWNKILESFGHTCAYCGKSHYVSTLVAEHIVPQSTISQFDVDSCNLPSNIVPACSECNHSKYTHPFEMWYKHQPFYDEQRYQKILRHIKKYEV